MVRNYIVLARDYDEYQDFVREVLLNRPGRAAFKRRDGVHWTVPDLDMIFVFCTSIQDFEHLMDCEYSYLDGFIEICGPEDLVLVNAALAKVVRDPRTLPIELEY